MPPSRIFPSFIWHVSFIKIFNNKCFLAYQHWKNMFLTKVFNESNNFQKKLWSIFSYIIFIFHLDFHTRISPITSLWNKFLIFILCGEYYFDPNISWHTKYSSFIEYFCWIYYIKFQNFENFQTSQYCHQI
jgi:hypothetical protein